MATAEATEVEPETRVEAVALEMTEPHHVAFATGVIRLYVPPSVEEEALKGYLRGIGAAMRGFEGFTSRKIVEMPQPGEGRLLLPLLKFSGATSAEAYANMKRWADSDELKGFMKQGRAIGLELEDADYSARAVGRVDISQRHPPEEKTYRGPPPKWKMAIIVEFWVFVLVMVHGFAGTGAAFLRTFHNEPFALLVLLACVVPAVTYWALPLTLSFPFISRWAHRRHRKSETTCLNDVWGVLEDGFLMFAPDDTLRRNLEASERRLAATERRLDMLERQGDIDAVKNKYHVDLSSSSKKDHDDDVVGECDEGGVAIAVRHHVRWGLEKDFEAWATAIAGAMQETGGFLGSDVFLEDSNEDTPRIYVALFRFQTMRELQTWLDSDARARFLLQLEPLIEAVPEVAQVGAGLRIVAAPTDIDQTTRAERNLLGELLFQEHDRGRPTTASPALYKVTILITLGLFLVAFTINAHLAPHLHAAMPHFVLGILVTTFCTVVGNTYFGAPFMTFFFSNWLTLPPGFQASALTKYLVHGSQIRSFNAIALFFYFALVLLVGFFS